MIKRQIAFCTTIKEILSGRYVKEEGWNPNYILSHDGRKISRANITGIIVEAQADTILIDDGDAQLPLRAFENSQIFLDVSVGDAILVVGRPREFNDEKYIAAEMISKVDPRWIEIRKKNIEKDNQPKKDIDDPVNSDVKVEDVLITDEFELAVKKIRELDKGSGVTYDELKGINESTLTKLLETGEIFEISPGRLKILE